MTENRRVGGSIPPLATISALLLAIGVDALYVLYLLAVLAFTSVIWAAEL